MPSYVKIDGQYKPWVKVWQKVAGEWVHTPAWHVNYRGEYKLVHETRTPFYFNKTLANTQNYNLREDLLASGWNGTDYVIATITIPVGVSVTASTPGFYAFSTGTTYPQDSRLTIVLNGVISGRGGRGAGGNAYNGFGQAATTGGPGLFAAIPTTVTGTGFLLGGGGGGGGGGGAYTNSRPFIGWSYAGGGGGGGGSGFGAGGPGAGSQGQVPAYWPAVSGGGAGGAGTANAGGGGGGGGFAGGYFGDLWSRGGPGGAGGLASAGFYGGAASWSGSQGGTTGPATAGALGGSAYSGSIDASGFAGTILGYRG